MTQAYAQFRGVMTVELGSNSQAAFSQFTNQAQRAGDSGARSMDRFNRSVEGLEGRLRAAGAGIGAFSGHGGRLASQFNAAANAIALTGGRIGGLIAAVAGGATLVGATNDIQNYTTRLRAATNGQAEFNSVYANLLRVSSATRSDLGETINFYTRLRIATSQLSLSQNELGGIIQTVQQSIRLSGAGAQEANAALIQFVQGISSANGLSGDEFKSLGENATLVLRNIAIGLKELNTFPGFDGTISALRKLGSEGKLTADVIVPALQQVFARVDADFKRLPPTIDQASTALRNSFLDLIVQGEKATGALSGIANAMLGLSRNLDVLGIAAAGVAGVLAGRLVPALLASRAALVAVAAFSIAGPIGGLTSGFAALAASAGSFQAVAGRLVGFLGGPWVVGLGAAATAIAFLATRKSEAAKAADAMQISEGELSAEVQRLTGYVLNQNAALRDNVNLKSERARREAQTLIDSARADASRAQNRLFGALTSNQSQFPSGQRGAVVALAERIRQGLSPKDTQIALNNLEKQFPRTFQIIGRQFDKAADQYALTVARVKAEEAKLTGSSAPAPAQAGAAPAVRTLKEVVAASKEGATAADRAREAVIALNKEFGIAGEKEFAKLSADRQNEYARRLTAIEQTKKAEIEAEKAAAAARRQGAREERQNEQLAIRAINSIARDLPDSRALLQEQIEAANKQAEAVTRIRQEDFARRATLDLQLQGEEATAEVLRRALQLKQEKKIVDIDTIRYLSQQVEAEAARNVAIERRNQLLAIESRALGQIQNAFTTLFTGNTRGFLSGIGDAFRQQIAQRLSLNIFGDAERDAQLANTGALEVNTSAIERLIAAMDLLGTRITAPPTESPLGPSLGIAAANDNFGLPGGDLVRSLTTTASSLSSFTRLLRDGVTSASIRASGGGFGSFGAGAGGRFGTSIGVALEGLFGGRRADAGGNIIPGGFATRLGRIGAGLGAGFEGFSAGRATLSILGDLGIGAVNSKQGKTGSAVGAIAGGGIAAAIGGSSVASALGVAGLGAKLGIAGGPIGIAVGALLGTIVGGLFGAALKKNPFGDVALRAGQSGTVFNSRGAGSGEQALTLADSVNQGLERLAQGLGVNLRTGANIGAIGFSGSQFFFNPTGGDFKAAGNQRFSEAEDAVAAAIRNAVSVGAFEGLREGSKRLLLAGADINAQAQKAADFEGVFTELRRAVDPTGAAVDELNKKFTRLSGIFVEAGANADEFGKLQQLYDLQRAQALEQANSTLRDFLTELTTSSGSGLSVRDRQSAAQSAFAGFRSDIEAGRTINQDAFRTAAQNLLDVNRELFGSQTGYFDTLSLVTDLTRRAISTTEGQQSLPEALRLANGPVTDGLSAVRGAIEAGFANLEDALARMNMAPANDWAGVGSGFTARQGGF